MPMKFPARYFVTTVLCAVAAVLALAGGGALHAAEPKPAATPAKAVPDESPLRTADEATRQKARSEAYLVFQRSCRPCHGSLGTADGPYNATFSRRAADLRRPTREAGRDATRFVRIRDGAAALTDRPWESSMPAFGDDLDAQQIWGLVLLLEDFGKEGSGVDPNATGGDVYLQRCAACHGEKGAGDGPLAAELLPPPRDFIKASYRMRSTKSGAAPLDSDIIGVAAHGLADTAMGRFMQLGSQRLEDVTAHVQSLAPAAFATTPPTIDGAVMPAQSVLEMAARGRAAYETAKCNECHGTAGRGDGPAAATLKDDGGHPSIPTDLTQRWRFKAGGSATDVFRTLMSGFNGTPMGSYEDKLSAEDRWAISSYVDRISRPQPRYAPNVLAIEVDEDIPLDPAAPFWRTIPPALMPLGPQIEVAPYWTRPSVDSVEIVAATRGDRLGILLAWNDASRDVQLGEAPATSVAAALARYGTWRLPDAIAIQVPDKLDPKGTLPPLYLGDGSHAVRRWLWSADRQEQSGTQAVVEKIGGPKSAPSPSGDSATVQTAAAYADGQWRVVFLTKRPPKPQKTQPFAVHAWNGSVGESDHWHSLSGWMNFQMD